MQRKFAHLNTVQQLLKTFSKNILLRFTREQRMSLKTKIILSVGLLAGIGFLMVYVIYYLHKRILEEVITIREHIER